MLNKVGRCILVASQLILWLTVSISQAQHQTNDYSPVIVGGDLPYEVTLQLYDFGETPLPSLHSYAKAQWDGKWLFIGGRTNGLHAFTQNGFVNFPEAFQNRDVWVVDPVNGQSWQRSLEEEGSGLTTLQVDSLTVTNNQFYQDDQRLYLTGGYGLQTDFDFVTFDTLTSIDVPGLMQWAQGAPGAAASEIRQIHDPLFTVTGGAMAAIGGRTHLVFGQDFQGEYTPFGNGVYTHQVRSFSIVDDGENLSVENVTLSEPDASYRRRDLNVVPVIRPSEGGTPEQELVAFSGVFTEDTGAWTVPVEIAADGMPTMADPSVDASAFKQAMNLYHSAKLGLYSEASEEMHALLFGGISLHYYDHQAQELVLDSGLPFINQSTSVVIDGEGNYTQHLLPNTFPEIVDEESGNLLRFGTNAEFMLADGIGTYENGVIRMDEIAEPTTLGYILGGIAADQPHRGNTAASGRIFEVIYTPMSTVCSPTNSLLGDLDGDGEVVFADFLTLSANFGAQVDQYSYGDVNCDGMVGFADFLELSANFGTSLSDAAESIPEPDGTSVVTFVLVMLCCRRRLVRTYSE